MIKQKLKEFFLWIRDHFHCLVEVVVRLSLGIEKKENPTESNLEEFDRKKGEDYDK